MRFAVLDLGSNTFHIMWGQVGRGGSIAKLGNHKHVVRLGADVPPGGVIAEAHRQRAMEAIADLVSRCPSDCRRLAVATSVFREAANGRAFIDAVRARFAAPVDIVTGEEEAELAYLGVTSDRPSPTGRIAVVDVGGGSIQLAVGEGPTCLYKTTLPLGVLRLAKRAEDLGDFVRRHAAAACRAVAAFEPTELVFASGTARLAARCAIEGEALSLTRPMTLPLVRMDVEELARVLMGLDRDALLGAGIPEGRLDTIGPGAVVMATIMDLMGSPAASVAETGLREGVIVRALRDGEARSGRSSSIAPPPL